MNSYKNTSFSYWRRISVFLCTILMAFAPESVFATIPDNLIDFYANNNILYYDPCSGTGENTSGNTIATALTGDSREEKIWNYIVNANIAGVSGSAEVISGILGNLKAEKGDFNPFYERPLGIVQWLGGRRDGVIAKLSEAGLGDYIGKNDVDESIVEQALQIELEFLFSEGQFNNFTSHLNDVSSTSGVAGARAYADLFLLYVEGAHSDDGTTAFEDTGVKKLAGSNDDSRWQNATGRRDNAEEYYNKYSGSTSSSTTTIISNGTSSTNTTSSCSFNTYSYSDDDLKELTAIAKRENGSSKNALKFELSIMANLYETKGSSYSSVLEYVKNSGWFSSNSISKADTSGVTDDELGWAKDIINNGNRTLPKEIDEHDCISCGSSGWDVESIEIKGKKITDQTELLNLENYVSGQTWINNKYGSHYLFYAWANGEKSLTGNWLEVNPGDPFGSISGEWDCDPNDVSTSIEIKDECGNTTETAKVFTGEFPYYNQYDERWRYTPYGTQGNTGDSGCGPTSFAMMATALLGKEILPDETTTVAGEAGMHYCDTSGCYGSSHEITRVLAEYYGLEYKAVSASNASDAIKQINQLLSEGWMIHTSGQGSSPFTTYGHYIGIRGLTDDGKWLIADSNGTKGEANTLENSFEPESLFSAGMYVSNIKAIRAKN